MLSEKVRDITKNEDMVYSIMNKKSRSKVYDEVEKHLIECKVMGQDNDISYSPFLKDCNGCEFNIGRKLNTGNV
ncbi:hypothetical protein RhiirA5_440477 [Rhizophagus irregularis]|uniref:Uncharacterized protein n=1 Tax=Rhizophagus irregularis TaxID=588596 RepID=A0A2N0NGM4_9GLOM|nr:hypothetical protein RhiirA5_440477 [Rhizophagus irregularis]